jgi:hypothetical protein
MECAASTLAARSTLSTTLVLSSNSSSNSKDQEDNGETQLEETNMVAEILVA